MKVFARIFLSSLTVVGLAGPGLAQSSTETALQDRLDRLIHAAGGTCNETQEKLVGLEQLKQEFDWRGVTSAKMYAQVDAAIYAWNVSFKSMNCPTIAASLVANTLPDPDVNLRDQVVPEWVLRQHR